MYCDFGIVPRHVSIREARVAFDVVLTLHQTKEENGIYFGEFLELLVRTALKRESSSTGSLAAAAVQSVMKTIGCGLFEDPDNVLRAAGMSPLLLMAKKRKRFDRFDFESKAVHNLHRNETIRHHRRDVTPRREDTVFERNETHQNRLRNDTHRFGTSSSSSLRPVLFPSYRIARKD